MIALTFGTLRGRGIVFTTALAATLLVGCKSAPPPTPEEMLPSRIGQAEASRRVEQYARQKDPSLSAYTRFPVEEITPPQLWEQLRAQTFRVTDDTYKFETFAVTDRDTAELGAGYQGPGLVAGRVGDLDGDGRADYAFATGGGSGNKRFEIGVLDRSGDALTGPLRQRRAPFSYRDPVGFADHAGGGYDVRDDARGVALGVLRDADGRLTFTPADDLPRGVRERFIEPRM